VAGACLCRSIRFEVSLPSLYCAHCHCSMCRRSHGAGFVTWFGISRSALRITAGEDHLVHHRSSDHATRSFCGRCGSSLFFASTLRSDHVDVALANMAAPIDRSPQMHVHFSDRAAWVTTDDALPRLGGASGLEPLEAETPAGSQEADD
jgi:hypothetical protein